jgi:hypothetical protein
LTFLAKCNSRLADKGKIGFSELLPQYHRAQYERVKAKIIKNNLITGTVHCSILCSLLQTFWSSFLSKLPNIYTHTTKTTEK